MRISIIIPIYNVENYILDCINSVINQSYRNIEVILVDDCGTDKSMEIIKDFLLNYNGEIKFQQISHNINKGLSAARNSGIKIATGEYIFFLDSDDTLPNDSIQNLVNKVYNHQNVDFIIGGIKTIGKQVNYPLLSQEYLDDNTSIFYDYIHYKWNVMACNKLYRRNFLIDNELFFLEGIYHEDMDFSFRVALSAQTMACCYENTYNYLIRGNSITTNKKLKNYSDEFGIIQKCFSLTRSIYYKGSISDDLYVFFISWLYVLSLYLITDNNKEIKYEKRKKLIIDIKEFFASHDGFYKWLGLNSFIKLILIRLPFSLQKVIFCIYRKIHLKN